MRTREGASPTQELHQLLCSRLRGRAFAVNEAASDTIQARIDFAPGYRPHETLKRSQRRLTQAQLQRRPSHACTNFSAPHPLQKNSRRRPFRASTTRQGTGLTYSQIGPSLTCGKKGGGERLERCGVPRRFWRARSELFLAASSITPAPQVRDSLFRLSLLSLLTLST